MQSVDRVLRNSVSNATAISIIIIINQFKDLIIISLLVNVLNAVGRQPEFEFWSTRLSRLDLRGSSRPFGARIHHDSTFIRALVHNIQAKSLSSQQAQQAHSNGKPISIYAGESANILQIKTLNLFPVPVDIFVGNN